MMNIIYFLFALLLIYAECSVKINTTNLFRKIGLSIMVISCLLKGFGYPNILIDYGVIIYFLHDFWKKLRN